MALAGLDIAILIIVGVSALIGLFRGLVSEVLSLLSWAVAILVTILFYPSLAQQLPSELSSDLIRVVISVVILFVGSLILMGMLKWAISQLVTSTGLSGTDRVFGLVFGAARGVLVCLIVLMVMRGFAAQAPWWQASVLREHVLALESTLLTWFGKAKVGVDGLAIPERVQSL